MNAPDRIHVDYEYGRLEEVFVGVPFCISPALEAAPWIQEAMKILPESEVRKAWDRSGKDSITLGKYEVMERENQELISVLARHGVMVRRPEVLTRERVAANFGESYLRLAGVSQQYARDPVIVVGDNVIECTMGSLYRRSDVLGLVRPLLERLPGSGARWVAMPAVDYSLMLRDGRFDKTGFPVLEGGDVIVLGRKVLVGTSANATTGSSEQGHGWLRAHLEPQGYDVERVPLPEEVLHLDVALSVPRPGLIVVCPEVFPEGIPRCFDGWRRVEVTREEARFLAVNGLPIDADHYVLGRNGLFDDARIRGALEAQGIEVHTVAFGAHTEDGGSIRCSTLPLVRRLRG
jgi:N-dimethylarginine dimethylaminohydrolase